MIENKYKECRQDLELIYEEYIKTLSELTIVENDSFYLILFYKFKTVFPELQFDIQIFKKIINMSETDIQTQCIILVFYKQFLLNNNNYDMKLIMYIILNISKDYINNKEINFINYFCNNYICNLSN